ncbi:YndJ family protein [Salibacterium halotolerans]|uniref:YndJ-like protein n=1 Tax=Salibacterium halotolerans TaxID=1884432 RepID=A0A1I5TUB2_9BACI|nr:YndJ family protein [Salibacterium halotolerans]SFP86187.1 YndJ-like protein [Salibacterium halotolerans]
MTKRRTLLPGVFSFILWAAFAQPGLIETALAAAFFLIVPAVLILSAVSFPGRADVCWFAAAWSGALSMMLDTEVSAALLAAVWFLFTGYTAWKGLIRWMARGMAPLEETAVDAGLVYSVVGGVWFVLSRAGSASWLPYTDVIVDLTAVHFHYAAFLLPVLTGALGRYHFRYHASGSRFSYRVLTAGVLSGPVLTAVAVDQGPPLEAVLVGIYVVFLYWFAAWSMKESFFMPLLSKITITVSSLVLLGTMTLSILYSTGRAIGYQIIGIAEMIPWHGAWNAFAFSTIALIGWAVVSPDPRAVYASFPISGIRGKARIAEKMEQNQPLKETDGLISSWDLYAGERFHPEKLDPLVSAFHTHTKQYRMKADIQWRFSFMYRVSSFFTGKIKQLNIPASGKREINGNVYKMEKSEDGHAAPRVWIRSLADTGRPVFTAVYGCHRKEEVTYFNIALPLPAGVMTGILRPEHKEDGALVLTSRKQPDLRGDEGIYVTIGRWTWKTPLQETFHMHQTKENQLKADHTMTIGRFRFLTITYHLPLVEHQEKRHDGAERFEDV